MRTESLTSQESSSTTSSEILVQVLAYAQRGWRILPLHTPQQGRCSCQGPNCTAIGKHPRTRRGVKSASTNSSQIATWWERWSEVNIGIATGAVSGMVALDVDGVDGEHSLGVLEQANGPLPETLVCVTGRGRHLLFGHPGFKIQNSAGVLGPSLDVRGDGGYIVAPPSVHRTGRVYRWVDPAAPIAEMPSWLADLLRTPAPTLPSSPAPEIPPPAALDSTDGVPLGERNTTLLRIAGRLRRLGLEPPEIEALLHVYNDANCTPPLDWSEVAGVALSVGRYPSGKRWNGLRWYPRDINERFCDRRVRMMSTSQKWWLVALQDAAWLRGGTLPMDPAKLHELAEAACSQAKFDRDCQPVLEMFTLYEVTGRGLLVDQRLALEFVKATESCAKQSSRGSLGGRPRK